MLPEKGTRGVYVFFGVLIFTSALLISFSVNNGEPKQERERLTRRNPSQDDEPATPKDNTTPAQKHVPTAPEKPVQQAPFVAPVVSKPSRSPEYNPGDVIRLKTYANNSHAWLVWHPIQFARVKEAQRIGDTEGISKMFNDRLAYKMKDNTQVRVLKHIEFGKDSGEDIYEIRVIDEGADWDSRHESKGLLGYAYAYSLKK